MDDLNTLLTGPRVELPRMLDAREHRVQVQQQLLQQFPMTLISFTLNIPGPVKRFPLGDKTYREGVELILFRCKACGIPIRSRKELLEDTGCECFLSTPADPVYVKKHLSVLEEEISIGRLFDIDILTPEGEKISRSQVGLPERKCLICQQPAFLCSRARAHSLTELLTHACHLMQDYFAQQFIQKSAAAACRCLLYEVLATPKPGLVDKANTGAHRDMDISTFETSALTLLPYFRAFLLCGMEQGEPESMLPQLRVLGLQAETDMLRATGGVNTHKGAIFSLGILLAALGRCYAGHQPLTRESLRKISRQIASPLQEELAHSDSAVSHGEALYRSHGVRGARGQAADGFPALFCTALPNMDRLLKEGATDNDAGVITLLHIIALGEDTNIMARSSYERMQEISRQLREFLEENPMPQVCLDFARNLDRQWITENISPGGSADLLALTYFILFLERGGLMEAP